MSFNMADLLNKSTKRGSTAVSTSEMEPQFKYSKVDCDADDMSANTADAATMEMNARRGKRTTSNDDNDDSLSINGVYYNNDDSSPHQLAVPRELYKTTENSSRNTSTATESINEKSIALESAKKKPYGGRPLKFQCQHCDRRFHAPSHLKRHVMSHSSERPFRCEVCDKGFLQAWHLGRHMTTHTGNKPFHCSECPRSFGSRFEMKTHINYIHRGIKEHQCNVCGKHFTLRSNLKVHMRKHTGEKPYKCSFCSKRFGQRGHLQYHIRKHAATMDNQGGRTDQEAMHAAAAVTFEEEPANIEADIEKSDYPSQCYRIKDTMTMANESDKDSGVDSCDCQSTTSGCSSPSVKDFDEQNSPTFDKAGDRDSITDRSSYLATRQPALYRRDYSAASPASYLKQFVCDMCNSGFESMSSLKAHVRHSHPRKGISMGCYRCAICLQGFSSVESLQEHANNGHHASAAPAPIKRTSIFFPSSNGSNRNISETKGHSEKSLAFSIERLCQPSAPSSTPSRASSPPQCSCCLPSTNQIVHHQSNNNSSSIDSNIMRSYHSFLRLQDNLRSGSY